MEKSKEKFEKQKYNVTVIDCEEIATDKYLLKLEKVFDFKPGQVVAISDNLLSTPRLYSICSGSNDDHILILFDYKADGLFSPKLASMKFGDKLILSEPFGTFLPVNEPMWWIATGTGIAPFYSMFSSGYQSDVKLIHGARTESNFYFANEIRSILHDNYIQCISDRSKTADFNGRVTDYLNQIEELPLDNKYYLCGQSLMVVEVRDLLIKRGIPFTNIVAEIYF